VHQLVERLTVPNRYCAGGAADGAADGAAEGAADGAADADGAAPPPAEDGLIDLIQAITFQTLSESLSTPPIGGISSSDPSEINLNSVSSSLP
jgi:hypothetical protein